MSWWRFEKTGRMRWFVGSEFSVLLWIAMIFLGFISMVLAVAMAGALS